MLGPACGPNSEIADRQTAGAQAMEKQEFRAAGALAAVFSVRLLGLFMIYPVFAAYARTLSGASPYLIGEALGIYGLTQGILQIPFGLLSDRIGRKVMIFSRVNAAPPPLISARARVASS